MMPVDKLPNNTKNSASSYVRRCATEVYLLKQLVASFEEVILENVKVIRKDHRAPKALQDLDLFAQSADAVGEFLERLAHAIPNDCDVDVKAALENVSLADIKFRLSGE